MAVGFQENKDPCKAKGCLKHRRSRNRKGQQQKTKAKLAELCVVQQRAKQTDSVQEQAGKMIQPLDEGLCFRLFVQWHCSLFGCCSGLISFQATAAWGPAGQRGTKGHHRADGMVSFTATSERPTGYACNSEHQKSTTWNVFLSNTGMSPSDLLHLNLAGLFATCFNNYFTDTSGSTEG